MRHSRVSSPAEPGGTPSVKPFGSFCNLLRNNSMMTPETELLLFLPPVAVSSWRVIRPASNAACAYRDRFFDSTTVYQGAARKLDRPDDRALEYIAVAIASRVTFVLNSMLRLRRSECQHAGRKTDRMEQQPAEFYEQVEKDIGSSRPRARPNCFDRCSREASETEKEIWAMNFCAIPRARYKSGNRQSQFAILRWPSRVQQRFEFLRRAYEPEPARAMPI